MERKPRSTAATIVLIITYILVVVPLGVAAFLALLKAFDACANTISGTVFVDMAVCITMFFGSIAIPLFLALYSLEGMQSKRTRKCYVIGNYGYAVALFLFGFLMFYVVPTSPAPFGNLREAALGIISFAAAALIVFTLTAAVVIFRFRKRKNGDVSENQSNSA